MPNTTPIFTDQANWSGFKFINSTGNVAQVIFTSSADGSRLERLLVSSCDDKPNTVFLLANLSGILYPLGQVDVPAGTGYTSNSNPINILESESFKRAALAMSDFAGNGFWDVPPNLTLLARVGATVTGGVPGNGIENLDATFGPASREIAVIAIGSDY